jgi:MFS family permease
MPATPVFRIAIALSMGAALSLGIARFAYGLLLPPMRADLGWSYALAGAMNTSNAAGYLLGALATPVLLRRFTPGAVLMAGSLMASLLLGVGALFTDTPVWLAQRLLVGAGSALVFVTGGLLAARLGATQPARGGLLIGLYYGGTGLGITASALVVPWVLQAAAQQAAWLGLGLGGAGVAVCCCHRVAALAGAATRPADRTGCVLGCHVRRTGRGASPAAALRLCAGRIRHVRCGVYRLHDLCGGLAA